MNVDGYLRYRIVHDYRRFPGVAFNEEARASCDT